MASILRKTMETQLIMSCNNTEKIEICTSENHYLRSMMATNHNTGQQTYTQGTTQTAYYRSKPMCTPLYKVIAGVTVSHILFSTL